MTPSEEVLARYRETEQVADSFGRLITVGRLRPSQQMAVQRMAETDHDTVISTYVVAASVRRIDDFMLSFPRNIGELNAVLDKLDAEGMAAATTGMLRLMGIKEEPVEADAAAA